MCTDDEDSPDLTEVLAAVRSLGARVTALQRTTRSTSTGETANLDEMDTETRKLVAAVERGKRARTMVSMQSVKGHPRVTIHDFENATRDREEHLKRALAASKVLASTDKWSSTRNDAAAAFRTASSELEGAESRIARLAEPARQARNQVDADDARRAAAEPQIQRGDAAWKSLYSRLDDRVSAAFESGAVMPTWFDTALGHPSAETQEWMDTAIDVLAFRLTFGITHPILALGPPPSEEQPQHRRDWYQDLNRRLTNLR